MTLDMKSSLIVILVLSLSLVGLSNSYAEEWELVTTIDGTSDVEFSFIFAMAVDSNDRIIVSDNDFNTIQIFDSSGNFLHSFDGTDGGTKFSLIDGIVVDSNDRIIVSDNDLDLIQIFDSSGTLTSSFDPTATNARNRDQSFLTVDSNDRIIVSDNTTVQIFDPLGNFISIFNGTDGGSPHFLNIDAIATDSNNRIIVSDEGRNIIHIFDDTGTFISSFDGTDSGSEFATALTLTVDANDRILVANNDNHTIQIFDSSGKFISQFDGGANMLGLTSIVVDSNGRIIVVDFLTSLVLIFDVVSFDDEIIPDEPKRSGGCADCVAPTLGVNSFNKRVVDDGFSYNGNSIQVNRWHTPFPLINATVGETNTVEIIIYENQGVNNMKLVQFGLGGTEIGQPLSEVEVLVEVWLDINSNNFAVKEIIINDKDNLIENSTVVAVIDVVKCSYNSQNETCLKVTLQYSYREPTIYHMMIVNLRDKPGNSQNFYLNEGIQVVGESLNEPPTYEIQNRQTHQQTEDFTLTLTRTDKVNHIWADKHGIEYLQVSEDRFDRITPREPYKCTDPPLGAHGDRNNCNFRNLTELWTYEQQE